MVEFRVNITELTLTRESGKRGENRNNSTVSTIPVLHILRFSVETPSSRKVRRNCSKTKAWSVARWKPKVLGTNPDFQAQKSRKVELEVLGFRKCFSAQRKHTSLICIWQHGHGFTKDEREEERVEMLRRATTAGWSGWRCCTCWCCNSTALPRHRYLGRCHTS